MLRSLSLLLSFPSPLPSARCFSTARPVLGKTLPPRPQPPPESEIDECFLKGSGPGGQKINKTSCAVQLKHLPTGLVVKSQATRSRSQNRVHARQLLAQKLDDLLNGENSRSARVCLVKKKRADSAAKKSRRKYRKLDLDKAAAADCASAAPDQQDTHAQSEAISRPLPSQDNPTSEYRKP